MEFRTSLVDGNFCRHTDQSAREIHSTMKTKARGATPTNKEARDPTIRLTNQPSSLFYLANQLLSTGKWRRTVPGIPFYG